jgi:hypothetical protein
MCQECDLTGTQPGLSRIGARSRAQSLRTPASFMLGTSAAACLRQLRMTKLAIRLIFELQVYAKTRRATLHRATPPVRQALK